MTHFAFVAPPFLGHMNPMRALAGELVGRGHRATFLHMPDASPLVGEGAIAFQPVGGDSHPPGTLAGVTRRMSSINGLLGLGGIIRDVAGTTDMLARELPGALRAIGADVLVCDGTEAAGGLVAPHLGMPFVSVANALPLNREPQMPPPFTDWRYDPSPRRIKQNLGGYRVSDWLMRRHRAVIARHADERGLGPLDCLEACLSPFSQISQTVAGFDFPRAEPPDVFHHCGPLRASGRSGAVPARDGRPLAYATLGTLQGGRASLMRRIAEAARRLDLQLVLAHGGRLSDDAAARLPGAPSAFAFVDQPATLDGAAVALVNGGLNTVLDALAAGVPLVTVPIAFEQGAIAARIERAGAGRTVSRRFLTARRLARAVDEVMRKPSYRIAAARLATEIAAAGGVRRAADIVERVAATGRPVTRADMNRPAGLERAA